MSTLAIRPFAHDDTEEVVALWRASGLTRSWNDPHRDIARKATTQPELFLVGTIDGVIADGSTTSRSAKRPGIAATRER